MKRIKDMWRISLLSLSVIVLSCQLMAQNVVFTAVTNASKVGVKDQVQLQYTVKDAQNLQSISPGMSPDFQIIGGPYQQQSSNTSINGNRVVTSQSITLTYILQPKHEGSFTIPPAVAKDAAGHSYQSNPVTIQVVAGSLAQQPSRQQAQRDPFGGDDDLFAMMQRMQQLQQQQMAAMQQQQRRSAAQPQQQQQQPQPEEDPKVNEDEIKKDLFIKVAVDKSKVHVGEQITTSYKLYSRLPMQVGISKLPTLNGFWTQDFDIPKQIKPTEEVLDGKKYQVFLLKKSALFPQQTGTLELDAAEAKGMVRIIQQVRRKMSDIFGGTLMMNDPFFNSAYYSTQAYKDVKVDLQSAPVKITVTELPEKDKPEGFGGAVGNFTIAGKIDKQELTTDDVATLTLNITGSGNLKLIEAPKLSLPNGIDTYDPQIKDTITGRSTTISGTKMITYAITPHTPGDYDIPSVAFSYFNPQTGKYVTEHTDPIKLHVKPGKHYAPSQTTGNGLALKDIHDIVKQPLNTIVMNEKPLLFTASYWSLYALPLVTFIGILVWKRRDEELSKDTVLLRSRRANKVALQRLVNAKKFLQQQNKNLFYEEISKAIWLYLSDKLGIPLSALSRDTAREALNGRKVTETLQRDIENVISECETALYASGGPEKMAHTYEEAIKVISNLEEVFKK
jgi:oxygen tolerance protein BatD